MGAALTDGTPIGDGSKLVLDPQVRLAIAQATDRQVLADKVYGGFATPAPRSFRRCTQTCISNRRTGGVRPGRGQRHPRSGRLHDGRRRGAGLADGERMSLRLLGRQESSESQKVVEYVKDWLGQIGIDVNVKIVSEDTLYEKVGNGDFDMFEWGWVVEPDPDYQLSTFTCDQRSTEDDGTIFAGLSGLVLLRQGVRPALRGSETRDRPGQARRDRQGDAADAVRQQRLRRHVYYDNPTAYRSDRWTNFTPQPNPDGVLLFQYGTWSYQSLEPVSADSGGSTSSAVASIRRSSSSACWLPSGW